MATRRAPHDSFSASRPGSGSRLIAKNHVGENFDASSFDFFAPPPPEIGPVLTQWSTLGRDTQFMNPVLRQGMIFGAMALVAGLCLTVGVQINNVVFGLLVGIPLGLFAGLIVWGLSRQIGQCTYVGELGAAQIWCRGSRDRIILTEVLLFASATDLRVKETRQYVQVRQGFIHHNIYRNTSYTYRWLNPSGGLLSLTGTYVSEQGTPHASDLVYFARRVELVWTAYLAEHLEAITNESDALEFALDDDDLVEIGDDALKVYIHSREETTIHPKDDIVSMNVDQGEFTIRSENAVSSFRLEDLSNSRLFLQAAQTRLR